MWSAIFTDYSKNLYICLAQVFFEPESSSDVEVVLQKYAEAVKVGVSFVSPEKESI
jgi:hypothetical protein